MSTLMYRYLNTVLISEVSLTLNVCIYCPSLCMAFIHWSRSSNMFPGLTRVGWGHAVECQSFLQLDWGRLRVYSPLWFSPRVNSFTPCDTLILANWHSVESTLISIFEGCIIIGYTWNIYFPAHLVVP